MGRYSVDKPRFIIASQGEDLTNLGLDVEGIVELGNNAMTIDDDGIIPFIQEPDFFADDITERIHRRWAIKRRKVTLKLWFICTA